MSNCESDAYSYLSGIYTVLITHTFIQLRWSSLKLIIIKKNIQDYYVKNVPFP